VSLTPCPHIPVFEVNLSAGFYSTLAGVLAGFAFVAVTYVLTGLQTRTSGIDRARERRSTENTIIVSLFCAFLTLVMAAFLYAGLAAEPKPSGRAASVHLLASVAFAFGSGILVFSLTLLISGVGLEHTAREVRTIVVLFLPSVGVLLVSQAARNLALTESFSSGATHCVNSALYDSLQRWTVVVLPLVVFLSSIALVVLSRTVLGPSRFAGLPQRSTWWLHNPLPKVSLIVVILTAARASALNRLDPDDHLSDAEVWFWLGVIAIGLLVQSVVSLWTRPGVPVTEGSGRNRAL